MILNRRTFLASALGFLAQRDRNGAVPRFLHWRFLRTVRRTTPAFEALSATVQATSAAMASFMESLGELEEVLAAEVEGLRGEIESVAAEATA